MFGRVSSRQYATNRFGAIGMVGAIAGDIIGSVHELIVTKTTEFDLFVPKSMFTDDTVLAVAVADCLLNGGAYVDAFQRYCVAYPTAGYGMRFAHWVRARRRDPYNSFGNGSAMRVPAVAYAFETLDEVLAGAARSAGVTHNHPEGIRGAPATAAPVFMGRRGPTKRRMKEALDITGYEMWSSNSAIDIESRWPHDAHPHTSTKDPRQGRLG